MIMKPDDVLKIVNMVYSVFLAILARFSIHQSDQPPITVSFLVSETTWQPVLLLSVYFLIDWLSTNITLIQKKEVTHIILPLMIVSIVLLGGLVAFSFSPSCWWFLFFGVYASVVPWYDIIGLQIDDEKSYGFRTCLIVYSIIFLRVVTGVFMLIIAILKIWLYPNSNLQMSGQWPTILLCITTYVTFKVLRYIIFVPLFRNQVRV